MKLTDEQSIEVNDMMDDINNLNLDQLKKIKNFVDNKYENEMQDIEREIKVLKLKIKRLKNED